MVTNIEVAKTRHLHRINHARRYADGTSTVKPSEACCHFEADRIDPDTLQPITTTKTATTSEVRKKWDQ